MHHRRTGQGQHVDISQVECMLPLVAPWIIEQSVTGAVAPRLGNRHPVHVPHGCFRCAGADEWVLIAVSDDAMWQALCAAIARPDLATDPELAAAAGRRRREAEIERAIEDWTAARGPDEAMLALQRFGVAAGAVRSPFRLDQEPHLEARGFWQPVERAFVGRHDQPSAPFREGAGPYPVLRPAPTLGEHNEQVLTGLLGLTRADLDRLAASNIIGTEALRRPSGTGRIAAE
jgi:crotonobetainyl-CoA:carnitine CoA-transferase CaiB-like acyl-CoA transferase